VLPVVVPGASFERYDPSASVTLATHQCPAGRLHEAAKPGNQCLTGCLHEAAKPGNQCLTGCLHEAAKPGNQCLTGYPSGGGCGRYLRTWVYKIATVEWIFQEQITT
jgi:hypothetical protein